MLTKRAARMRAYLSAPTARDGIDAVMNDLAPAHWCSREIEDFGGWPLPNVWLGVSAEDRRRADERVPDLLSTPAAVRFVSAEPLLGPIDFTMLPTGGQIGGHTLCGDVLRGPSDMEGGGRLDWIIVGGESGPKARATQPAWVRAIRDQCAAAGTAFFFKQWGAWQPRAWCRDGGTHAMHEVSGQISF